MKWLDEVKVIHDRDEYIKEGVFKNAIGTIILSEIRGNSFEVVFSNPDGTDYAELNISVGDLELVRENENISDKEILNDLPLHNPKWWCKVENGFIINLLGEKKNKIPYDYNS